MKTGHSPKDYSLYICRRNNKEEIFKLKLNSMKYEENAIKSAEKVAPENFANFVKALFRRFDEEKRYFADCKKDIENELRQIVAAIRMGSIPANGRLPVYQGYIKSRCNFSPDSTLYVFVDNLAIYTGYLHEALKDIATVTVIKSHEEDTVENEIVITFNQS